MIMMATEDGGIFEWARAMLLGASGYLHKPVSQAELLKVMFKNLP